MSSQTTPVLAGPVIGRRADVIRKASVAIGFVVLFVVFSALTSTFYQPANLVDIMLQSSINAVIAVGMTLVIMTKGIDLSVGSIVGISSMVAASMLGHGVIPGILSGLAVGLVCGLLNGLMIAKLRLPDFIVTLGTLSIYRGAALIYTEGQPIYGLPTRVPRHLCRPACSRSRRPSSIALVIALGAFLLVRFTALGEQIIAVGGNEEAARLSGVNIDRVKLTVYTISGCLSSVAGLILIARIGAAEPIGGNGFELQAIGSAVIGGASLFGGVGNPIGSLVGALTLGGLQNGLTLINVPSFWQFVASGLVVILAVFADQSTRRMR